jgi:hypothetical protein
LPLVIGSACNSKRTSPQWHLPAYFRLAIDSQYP